MRTRPLLYFTILFIFLFSYAAKAQLEIIPETNAQALAQRLVGSGVVISNITLKASPLSTAFFINHGGASIGLNSGIVLSSGRVLSANDPYGLDGPQGTLVDNPLGEPGDRDLSSLIGGKATRDAAILEFDFVPAGDTIEFRYVFSSEEYPDYVCSDFNDVFAFFIEGPGITGKKNIALVPGTNIPIAINSINSGFPGRWGDVRNCNAMGPGSPFAQYFVDYSDNPFFTHDGHTVVLTASAKVVPCQTYHLKIAISDAGEFMGVPDDFLDSGVFIEARSLSSPGIKIINDNPLEGNTPYLVEGCHTGAIRVRRDQPAPTGQAVSLSFSGTAVNGIDINSIPSVAVIPANEQEVTIPITPIVDKYTEGIEKLKIYIANACPGTGVIADSIEIDIRDAPLANAGKDTATCYGKIFQLSGSGGTTYQWKPEAEVSNPLIADPLITPTAPASYYLKVKDKDGCESLEYDTVVVSIVPPVRAFAGRDTAVAIGQPLQLQGIELENKPIAVYQWAPFTGLNNAGVANPVSILEKDIAYRLTITTAEGCVGTDEINIKVYKGPEIYVPTGFTPNRDGHNDILKCRPIGIKSFTFFKVYNRWGEMVFTTSNEAQGWDGTIKGVKQNTGTYVWLAEAIDYKGNKLQKKGSVLLIR